MNCKIATVFILVQGLITASASGEDSDADHMTESTESIEGSGFMDRYYEYSKNGEMYKSELLSMETPINFSIRLKKDGTYTWRDDLPNSYSGMGQYAFDGDILTMNEMEYAVEGRKVVMKKPDRRLRS